MKKFISVLLALSLLLSFSACTDMGVIGGPDGGTLIITDGTTISVDAGDSQESDSIPEDGWYYSAEDVALYLATYGYLPSNFITKSEARKLGWDGGSVEDYAPGFAIGGDPFFNREELLPEAPGRDYYECDIDTDGARSRGPKRLVYSNDGLIYYTEDHYESFVLLYDLRE